MNALQVTAFLVIASFVRADAAPEGSDAAQSQVLYDILNPALAQLESQATSWTPVSRQSKSSGDGSVIGAIIEGFLEFLNQWSSQSDSPSRSDDSNSGGRSGFAQGEPLHDQATSAIANAISSETGSSPSNYESYASKLADTLGSLDQAALGRVLEENAAKLP